MKRAWILLALMLAGCSTAPIADLLDWIAPGRPPQGVGESSGGVCAPQGTLPGAAVVPVPLAPPVLVAPPPGPGVIPAQPPGVAPIPAPPVVVPPVAPPSPNVLPPVPPGTTSRSKQQPVPFPY